jgi:hypothetical protein
METSNILYDYVLWYAIKREHITAYFAGGDYRDMIPEGGYVKADDLDSLIDIIFLVN